MWLLGALFETYPGRLATVLGVAFLNAAGMSAAGFFVPKYLQEAHQWSPGQVSALYVNRVKLPICGTR
jgi:hypothetical protein